MKLYDSDTAEELTTTDLGITVSEYIDAIRQSIESSTEEGHVRINNGRRVYAAE